MTFSAICAWLLHGPERNSLPPATINAVRTQAMGIIRVLVLVVFMVDLNRMAGPTEWFRLRENQEMGDMMKKRGYGPHRDEDDPGVTRYIKPLVEPPPPNAEAPASSA